MKSLSLKYGIGLLSFLLLGLGFAPLGQAQSVRKNKSKKISKKSIHQNDGFALNLGVGLGSFQDIVVLDDDRLQLASEDAVQTATQTHTGVPLHVGMVYDKRYSRGLNDVRVDYLYMNKVDRPVAGRGNNPTYNRFELSGGTRLELGKQRYRGAGIARMGARRVTYSNLSSAHYLDAVIPKIGVGLISKKSYSFELTYGHSIYSKFGFNDGNGFAGEALTAESSLQEIGFKADFFLTRLANLGFSVVNEMVQVTMQDARVYNDYGFNLSSPAAQPREYQLTAMTLLMNFSRSW